MYIDHINLVVADLERSAAFYEALFGFVRGFARILEGSWLETVTGLENGRAHCLFLENLAGGTRLELLRYEFPTSPGFPVPAPHHAGWRHVAFEVEDLALTLEKARFLQAVLLSEPVEVPFLVGNLGRKKLCYLRDPDGHLLEIAAYEKGG